MRGLKVKQPFVHICLVVFPVYAGVKGLRGRAISPKHRVPRVCGG